MKKEKKIHYAKVLDGQEVFSTFDVLRILEIKRGRLVQWMKSNFIPKGSQVAWGEGSKTVFGLHDLYTINAFKLLVEMGMNRMIASSYADRIEWDDVTQLKEKYLVIIKDEENKFVIFKKDESLIRIKDYESVIFLNLGKIVEKIDMKT